MVQSTSPLEVLPSAGNSSFDADRYFLERLGSILLECFHRTDMVKNEHKLHINVSPQLLAVKLALLLFIKKETTKPIYFQIANKIA